MPTGYTNELDENPDMTTEQWVIRTLARAFGVCVALREEPMNLTEEQIKQKIIEDGQWHVSYHLTELKKSKKLLKEISTRTDEQWETIWKKHETEKKKQNKQEIAETNKVKQRHQQVFDELQKLVESKQTSDFTKKVARYGMKQLTAVYSSDCVPYISKPLTLEEFKTKITENAKRDFDYHTEELRKTKNRNNERLSLYLQLQKDVKKVFSTNKPILPT
jgi:hypothetical protein